ncbi:uncharacterized protein KD926_003705 [Aspergillus affinis]|uniref:uncharacterized protein n=1 Tax=Aspergillus affinis TaxID=1070780 RepID=UPI0022FE21B2|nr:uncharacterized protein KD926_003705 [Aspergillus affinis]KAI9035361.1 hypothetical protein KD926_003705 [Aspergillus affinis]
MESDTIDDSADWLLARSLGLFDTANSLIVPEDGLPDASDTPAAPLTITTSELSSSSLPSPPTDRVFSNERDAMTFINRFTKEHGYALTTKNSKRARKTTRLQHVIYNAIVAEIIELESMKQSVPGSAVLV